MAKTKIALLYERLSRDDELSGESFSIRIDPMDPPLVKYTEPITGAHFFIFDGIEFFHNCFVDDIVFVKSCVGESTTDRVHRDLKSVVFLCPVFYNTYPRCKYVRLEIFLPIGSWHNVILKSQLE